MPLEVLLGSIAGFYFVLIGRMSVEMWQVLDSDKDSRNWRNLPHRSDAWCPRHSCSCISEQNCRG
jgi:hypothetical protein